MVGEQVSTNTMFLVMFWTIIAMMLVLLYSLKQVIATQTYIKSIDKNIERMVRRIDLEEQRIINDIEGKGKKSKRK